ncbi:conserved hypothetical protein [Talaromyces stipitatus ATCC 10500]|uniref:Uncharacterized protein n=1 Tax=Talaromyces stipitatus (strain ATCC 10500 / CBS 375.48 / QM 6759 / NRRL 1006) TaxID=441959 RepID=B8M9P6_TALSN|nr:uncharacterized protein TSTA_118180 [Talaromyces stipitatus ATCC 10500]EED18048.1 conserved hypothetical protein [Talaromyces stipitatus ATCC 10500]
MKVIHILSYLSAMLVATAAAKKSCAPFPDSMEIFTSGFEEPAPPLVKSSYNTSFLQHKWNANLSHITSGYIYNLPKQNLVISNEAYDGNLAASTFNYANISKDGLVDNTIIYIPIDGNDTNSESYRGYVNPGFPLIKDDFLVSNGASYGGLVRRELLPDKVASWKIMYQGSIPVTVYVDSCDVVVGYDFFSPYLRTYVITMYFNTQTA